MLVVGVDPGAQGGFAVIDAGRVVFAEPLPVRIGHRGKTELDAAAFDRLVARWNGTEDNGPISLAVVEDVHAIRGDAIVSLWSFAMNTGRLLGVLEARSVPTQRVPAPTWKAKVLRDTDRSKAAAIGHVQARYPEVNLMATPRSKKPHDGIADAVCLAEFGWRFLMKGE